MIEILIAFTILANTVRQTPLVPDITLSERAQARAEILCENRQWSHDGWLDSFKGLSYKYAGENLAKDFKSDEEIQKAWMASPTHRANILKEQYNYIGIGRACGITVSLFKS